MDDKDKFFAPASTFVKAPTNLSGGGYFEKMFSQDSQKERLFILPEILPAYVGTRIIEDDSSQLQFPPRYFYTRTGDSTEFLQEADKLRSVSVKMTPWREVIMKKLTEQSLKEVAQTATGRDEVVLMGHSANRFGGIPNSRINSIMKDSKHLAFFLATCNADDILKSRDEPTVFDSRLDSIPRSYGSRGKWAGVNPLGKTMIDAIFGVDPMASWERRFPPPVVPMAPGHSRDTLRPEIRTPVEGRDYMGRRF